MTLCATNMKPKTMVTVKQEVLPNARGSVLVNNLNGAQRTVIANGSDLMRCKRKNGFLPGQPQPFPGGAQPASVARRNARERNRVKQVNNGFATLRSHIPPSVAAAISTEKPSSRSSAASKKLSKVETLKMAVEYIRNLQQMLDEQGGTLEGKMEVYEPEDRYYSSSPETVVSGEAQYYPNSPEGFTKSEPAEPTEYFSPGRTFIKTENYQHFNPEVHETLTAEFYHARSPVKTFSSPEREPPEAHAHHPHAHTHAFLQPRSALRDHRGSTSLSPPMSDAPSPTPSFASDNSSLNPGSSCSGQLSSQLSRLTTHLAPPPRRGSPVAYDSYDTPTPVVVHPAPTQRRGSPGGYDSYEAMSPEDEELLDVISWWQQTN